MAVTAVDGAEMTLTSEQERAVRSGVETVAAILEEGLPLCTLGSSSSSASFEPDNDHRPHIRGKHNALMHYSGCCSGGGGCCGRCSFVRTLTVRGVVMANLRVALAPTTMK